MQQRIREQLVGIAAAQNALAQIETAANFLGATLSSAGSEGRGAIGELLLGERLTLDMRMSEEERGRLGSTITQQIKLKHIDALCEMLRQLVGVDPLDSVSALYRAELEEEAERSLKMAVPLLEMPVLLPVLRGFIVTRCVAEDIGAGSALADSLAWCTDDESGDFLSELSWFKNFPTNVPMGSAVAALRYLEKN